MIRTPTQKQIVDTIKLYAANEGQPPLGSEARDDDGAVWLRFARPHDPYHADLYIVYPDATNRHEVISRRF